MPATIAPPITDQILRFNLRLAKPSELGEVDAYFADSSINGSGITWVRPTAVRKRTTAAYETSIDQKLFLVLTDDKTGEFVATVGMYVHANSYKVGRIPSVTLRRKKWRYINVPMNILEMGSIWKKAIEPRASLKLLYAAAALQAARMADQHMIDAVITQHFANEEGIAQRLNDLDLGFNRGFEFPEQSRDNFYNTIDDTTSHTKIQNEEIETYLADPTILVWRAAACLMGAIPCIPGSEERFVHSPKHPGIISYRSPKGPLIQIDQRETGLLETASAVYNSKFFEMFVQQKQFDEMGKIWMLMSRELKTPSESGFAQPHRTDRFPGAALASILPKTALQA